MVRVIIVLRFRFKRGTLFFWVCNVECKGSMEVWDFLALEFGGFGSCSLGVYRLNPEP